MKSVFKNIYTRDGLTKHLSPVGSRIHIKYGWIYEDGDLVYAEKGKTNTYEEIQAAKDSVDLHAIMKRYENGDESALDKVQGMYIDTVDLPKNYAQLYDQVSKANMVFDAMPAEIKKQYNNNPATFWKNYGKDEFDNVINEYRKEVFSRYGLEDEKPVATKAATSEMVDISDKEVNNNVEKSE